MKVIVGLGNPGPRYDNTRHNVGWWVLDRLAYDWNLGSFGQTELDHRVGGVLDGVEFLLIKPSVYVNRSGMAVSHLRLSEEFLPSEDLLAVVDDTALEVGRIRFRSEGGSGGHNGLRSVSTSLGTESYGRLRVGVGNPTNGVDMSDWVLSEMSPSDEEIVLERISVLAEAVQVWMTEGMDVTMNRFNN